MSVPRDELIVRLTDFLLALSRVAASVADSAWAQALMNRGEHIARRVINPVADTSHLTIYLDSVDELLRLMPSSGITQQKLVLQARKAALSMRYALVPLEESRPEVTEALPLAGRPLTGLVPPQYVAEAEEPRPRPTLRPSADGVSEPAVQPAPKASRRAVKPHVMSKNKEAILNFIQRTPRARTKDIIDGFNVLSQRTVKRNLKELIRSGMVQKRAEHKAVYYFAIDLN